MVSRTYVILVIDDDLVGAGSRRASYESVFGDNETFKLKYIERIADLNTIKSERVDGYLIDIFLEKWGGLKASDIMERYIAFAPRPAPIFLVSAKWGEGRVTEELKRVAEIGEASRQGSRVKHYFFWDEFSVDETNQLSPHVAERTRQKLQLELDFWQGRSYATLGDDESLRILHVSDPQYGDPAISGDSRLDNEVISRYLMNSNLSPHLIAVTGDLSFSGCPTEFIKARCELEELVSVVFDCGENLDAYRERIILVPGNHDVNLRLSACSEYSYSSFGDSEAKPILCRKEGASSEEIAREYDRYSWKPFREFATDLTRDRRWLDVSNNELCWVSDTFRHWGIQLIPLNSVNALNAKAPSLASISENGLKSLNVELRDNGGLFRIALLHHGREELGRYEENSAWQLLGGFLATNDIRLLLHGHRHEAKGEYCTDQCFGERPLNISMAPSLTLNSKARRENSLRGFTIIELEREAGKVKGGKIIPFEIRNSKISLGNRMLLQLDR